jgi:TIR domain-containing protein
MARYAGLCVFLLLGLILVTASARAGYTPPPQQQYQQPNDIEQRVAPTDRAANSSSETPPPPNVSSRSYLYILGYLVLIGIGGLIAFFVYRSYSTANENTGRKDRETLMEPQPRQRPTSVPAAVRYVPGSVFISYRRDDSADITGRIYDRLVQHFSREIVFKDVDSIPLGIDFRQHLEGALSQCRVLLAVLGDQWMGSETADGKRRIEDPRDHVRLELELALSRNIPVIAVLVRKASIPDENALPPSLRSLAYRNGIQVRPDPDFHGDIDRLIKGIEPHLKRESDTLKRETADARNLYDS